MGNAPIQIAIKTDKTTYRAGETITGTVYLRLSHHNYNNQYHGIQLTFQGHEQTQVRTKEETHSSDRHRDVLYHTERASASLVHFQVPLVETLPQPFQPGRYEVPFEWTLPINQPLPSSFQVAKSNDTGECRVVYHISAEWTPRAIMAGRDQEGTTKATQVVQILAVPPPPNRTTASRPLTVAPTSTLVHGMCCCWQQGMVELGWSIPNRTMLSPGDMCHLTISGQNLSQLDISALRVQLVETVRWRAGHDDADRSQQRTVQTTPVDYLVSVEGRPEWRSSKHHPQQHREQGYTPVVHDHHPPRTNDLCNDAVTTSFRIPCTVRDTYVGQWCQVQHSLVVSAPTRACATTPQASHPVVVAQSQPTTTTTTKEPAWPVATVLEDHFAPAVVIPADWMPDETWPVVQVVSTTTTTNHQQPFPTAHAVLVDEPSAPMIASLPSAPTQEQVVGVAKGSFT